MKRRSHRIFATRQHEVARVALEEMEYVAGETVMGKSAFPRAFPAERAVGPTPLQTSKAITGLQISGLTC